MNVRNVLLNRKRINSHFTYSCNDHIFDCYFQIFMWLRHHSVTNLCFLYTFSVNTYLIKGYCMNIRFCPSYQSKWEQKVPNSVFTTCIPISKYNDSDSRCRSGYWDSPPSQGGRKREKSLEAWISESDYDAVDKCGGHCSNGDEKSRCRICWRWRHRFRNIVVVHLCWDLLLPRPFCWYYVRSHPRSHVSRPCRSRDSSA